MTDRMLRAGIIGAGQIAWRYDGGRWDGKRSVSHAACLERHPMTTLVAMLEPVPSARQAATEALGDKVLVTGSSAAFFAQNLDLVCICSPTAHHDAHIRAAEEAGARYLLIEKPVTEDMAQYAELMEFWNGLSNPPRTFVNYFRRGLPQVQALRAACRTQGAIALDFVYSRGLAVNGVHMLDLCGFLLDFERAPEIAWVDPAGGASPSFALRAGPLLVTFRGLDLPYHCIECRATFAHGRLTMFDGGRRLDHEPADVNLAYPGFFHLRGPSPAFDAAKAEVAYLEGTYLSLCELLDISKPSGSPLAGSGFAQYVLALVMAQVQQ